MVAPAEAVFLDAKLEADLVELSEEEAREMLEMNGQDESGLDQLARGLLDSGLRPDCRLRRRLALTIYKGWDTPQAAGVISL